ncbi:sensor histidine kinase [Flavobacterium gelatinilyticum]|uniref:sensor histidine kinase n=1 Tax=Flavobacterium gelatinilyticum TaxID=3003260 RepID=UPI002480A872|nr:sensor histidine kinase [Flavobacterium gelatinilyticum]
MARQYINAYTFTPEAALATLMGIGILFVIILFFIRKWQKSDGFNTGTMLKILGSSLFMFVISMLLIGFLTALAFDTVERNFNPQTLTISLFSHFLDGFIYSSFFLAYYYYQDNIKKQQKLASYNEALSESKINQLKKQLNPHFLFNNLNVLDQLIEEDKDKASDFLNEFAEIYRYVLQSTDKELVRIEEEIVFARQYFKLIHYKYGNAYQLKIENKSINGFIVPMTLQLLLENAVQHNLGTKENPVCIEIKTEADIFVSNNINLKRNVKPTSGRALKNLKEQYGLLSGKPIEINQIDNIFSVRVPIINNQNT